MCPDIGIFILLYPTIPNRLLIILACTSRETLMKWFPASGIIIQHSRINRTGIAKKGDTKLISASRAQERL